MTDTLNIEEFMDQWAEKEPTIMRNMAVAQNFFAQRFERLVTTPQGYARAFDALDRHIEWKGLHNYERILRATLFETAGLYAAKAGKTLRRTLRPTISDWRTSTKKACAPFWDAPPMHQLMSDVLQSRLAPSEQLAVCRHAHPSVWVAFPNKNALLALMPANEIARLEMLPWAPDHPVANQQKLALQFCPTLAPMLQSLLPNVVWHSRAQVVATLHRVPGKTAAPHLDLPVEFEP